MFIKIKHKATDVEQTFECDSYVKRPPDFNTEDDQEWSITMDTRYRGEITVVLGEGDVVYVTSSDLGRTVDSFEAWLPPKDN